MDMMDKELHKEFETVERRISRLESAVESIATNQSRIETAVGELASEVRKSLSSITTNVSMSKITDWRTLASWAAIILSVVALVGSGYVREQNRIEAKVEAMASEITTMRATETDRILDVAGGQVDRLERAIRAENELRDELVEARIENIGVLLDRLLTNKRN